MIVKQRYVEKNEVIWCKENDTSTDVLNLLNNSGYRCIPILDEQGKKFVGNAYKVDILEHKLKHGNEDLPISQLAVDQDGTIHEESSYFEIFFSIKRLPYLAVLDNHQHFVGILTHSKVFELLEEAWGYKTGSCALTITFPDTEGIVAKILKIIKKKSKIHGVFSMDDDRYYLRRIIVTLAKGGTSETVKEIEPLLNKAGAQLIDIEVFNEEDFQ